jgi:hypothetical protein
MLRLLHFPAGLPLAAFGLCRSQSGIARFAVHPLPSTGDCGLDLVPAAAFPQADLADLIGTLAREHVSDRRKEKPA